MKIAADRKNPGLHQAGIFQEDGFVNCRSLHVRREVFQRL
jgi:hypothetical protein